MRVGTPPNITYHTPVLVPEGTVAIAVQEQITPPPLQNIGDIPEMNDLSLNFDQSTTYSHSNERRSLVRNAHQYPLLNYADRNKFYDIYDESIALDNEELAPS